MSAQVRADGPLAQLAKLWWLWIVFGVAWIIISFVILQMDQSSANTIGWIVGLMLIAAGVQEIIMGSIAAGWRWLWYIFGAILLIAGIVALFYPKNTFIAIADMLGFIFLLLGVMWIIEAFATRGANPIWWLGLIAGILMLVMAVWTSGQFFFTRAYVLFVFAGLWALMHGITDIFKAFAIKQVGKMVAA